MPTWRIRHKMSSSCLHTNKWDYYCILFKENPILNVIYNYDAGTSFILFIKDACVKENIVLAKETVRSTGCWVRLNVRMRRLWGRPRQRALWSNPWHNLHILERITIIIGRREKGTPEGVACHILDCTKWKYDRRSLVIFRVWLGFEKEKRNVQPTYLTEL